MYNKHLYRDFTKDERNQKATRTPFVVKQRKDNLRMLYNNVV